jgi:hypothetical protein
MTEFDKGWWNCFISFANELCMWERDCDKVIQAVMCGAGVKAHEIDWVLNEFDEILEDRVKQELLRYKDRKLSEE